jgi:tRNA1Val (adenine37-N6)-methyltransferase
MSVFKFKQFLVHQDACAMKVGTDATLLGAWADLQRAENILDIGTGTGVLALMAAQRNLAAKITAVELDEAAFHQAKNNFSISPWANRLRVFHRAIQKFETENKFEVIISNPPFYDHTKHLKAAEEQRRLARSTDTLAYADLCASASRLLSPEGSFQLILPTVAEDDFVKTAASNQLMLHRKTLVFPKATKAANRVLMAFSKVEKSYLESSLTIRNASSDYHDYSPEFIELLRDFLIIF